MKNNLLLLLLLISAKSFGQDFYSPQNSKRFAEYLYQTGQYEYAAKEFERCHFLEPQDPSTTLSLLKVYRKLAEYEKGSKIAYASDWLEKDEKIGSEYFKMLIQSGKYADADSLLTSRKYFEQNLNLKLSTILLQKKWKEGSTFESSSQQKINPSLLNIVDQSQKYRRKSPFLAGLMSAVIPGSGKVYSKRWQDGLISFVMNASSGFVTIRGLRRDNTNPLPWVMGAFFVTYYTGNIYGSVHAAKLYNQNKEDEWMGQVRDFVLHD